MEEVLADDMPGVNQFLMHTENKSKLVGELVAVGSFKLALANLTKQIGAKNYAAMKSIFADAFLAAQNNFRFIGGLREISLQSSASPPRPSSSVTIGRL